MVISFWRKIFIGVCGLMLIVATLIVILFNRSPYNTINEYGDPGRFVYWIQHFRNSSVPKNDSNQCILPFQWRLKSNVLNASKPIKVLNLTENNTCLELLIKTHCYEDNLTIPNVVHYVIFDKTPLKIFTFLSYLSAWKHLRPCFIVIHGDLPFGPLFEKFLRYNPRIIHVTKTPKDTIYEKKIFYVQHKADLARLEIIIKYGGIYLDYDEIVLRSFDDLRNHNVVLGQETDHQLGNGVIIAKPSATFLKIWLSAYQSYDPTQWAVHSTIVPFQLSRLLKQMVFIVQTFFQPNYLEIHKLYGENIDWSNFYAMHLYEKTRILNDSLEDIRYKDNTYGSVARYIYYGNKDLQKRPKKGKEENITDTHRISESPEWDE